MTLVLYICIVIIAGELSIEISHNIPRSPEHALKLGHAVFGEIFTTVLLWVTVFFFNCIKMSIDKNISSALNRRS